MKYCSDIGELRDHHTEWSMSDKDKYYITYMWNLRNNTNELIYKTETDSQTQKTYGYQRENGWRERSIRYLGSTDTTPLYIN